VSKANNISTQIPSRAEVQQLLQYYQGGQYSDADWLIICQMAWYDLLMKRIFIVGLFFLISSCAVFVDSYQEIFVDSYQENQTMILEYLLTDLPLPDDSKIIKDLTVILGTGNSISGRVSLESSHSPAENLIFFDSEVPSNGWQLASSKVGDDISLIYKKGGRYADIYITPRTGFKSFFSGSYESDIVISITHPESIEELQNRYDNLSFGGLPDSP
jgi:hypothetical protein